MQSQYGEGPEVDISPFVSSWRKGILKRQPYEMAANSSHPSAFFALEAAGIPTVLVLVSRGRTLPQWMQRLPIVGSGFRALAEATPGIAHDGPLIAQCMGIQVASFMLDSRTLWIMLCALRLPVPPAQVFASFMLSTLARTLGPVPGGLGIFEAASVATLKLIGVPIAAGLATTLLFRVRGRTERYAVKPAP